MDGIYAIKTIKFCLLKRGRLLTFTHCKGLFGFSIMLVNELSM